MKIGEMREYSPFIRARRFAGVNNWTAYLMRTKVRINGTSNYTNRRRKRKPDIFKAPMWVSSIAFWTEERRKKSLGKHLLPWGNWCQYNRMNQLFCRLAIELCRVMGKKKQRNWPNEERFWIQDFNGVWTRDLAIPVRRSNQLSYEATDVGSWSFVSSNEPVKNGCFINISYIIFIIFMKWFEIHDMKCFINIKMFHKHVS